MFVWFLLGIIGAGIGIAISWATTKRGLANTNKTRMEFYADAIIGGCLLILMVVFGPISLLVDILLILSYMKLSKSMDEK